MQSIEFIKIVSEPLRVRILMLLKEASLSVSELVTIAGQSQSNISHHIKLLKDMGLIDVERHGNINLYSLIKNPQITVSVRTLWENLSQIAEEIPENIEDMRKLVLILAERQKQINSESWSAWRKAQPDLPYTAEVAFAGMPRNGIALDIGCGDGGFINSLNYNFKSVIGIDISVNQIIQAKKNITNGAILLAADALCLPLEKNSINSVYLRMVLGFLSDATKALKEAIAALKPGGRISVIDKNFTEAHNRFSINYFNDFCDTERTCSIVFYKQYPKVFICCLEKMS